MCGVLCFSYSGKKGKKKHIHEQNIKLCFKKNLKETGSVRNCGIDLSVLFPLSIFFLNECRNIL